MKKIINLIRKKQRYFKTISVVLILALLIQTISIAVSAIAESDFYVGGSGTDLTTSNDSIPNVVAEVEECRDMYTKVYELQDGSFYEVISTKPIHENVNGNWIEPENNYASPVTTNEVVEYCEELSDAISTSNNSGASTFSFDLSVPSSGELDFIVVNSIGTQSVRLTSARTMYVNIPCTRYGEYTYNQVTIDCKLYIDCQNINTGNMYIHEIKQSWSMDDDNITSESIYFDDTSVIDTSSIINSAPGEYSFDITDLFIKWEKGSKNNNGIAVKTDNDGKANIGGCYITRVYKTIDSLDMDFTYHTVDMGRAGTVYINDYTNSVLLARKELGLEGNIMPVELIRYFDFSKAYATTNPSGEGARWNYESSLKMVTSLTYSWETFEGGTINFVPNQGMFNWADSKGEGYVLVLDSNAINYSDYSNVYIISPDDIKYQFGKAGKVSCITDTNINSTVSIVYNSEVTQNTIKYIEDGLNRRYIFNYSTKEYTLANGINTTVNVLSSIYAATYEYNSAGLPVYTKIKIGGEDVEVFYEYTPLSNNHLALSKVTYPDGGICYYEYDSNDCLSRVLDIDNRRLTLDYMGETPSYMQQENGSYITYFTPADQHPCVVSYKEEVKNIDDDAMSEDYVEYLEKSTVNISRYNNYQRIFTKKVTIQQNDVETDMVLSEETVQYDNKLNILYMKNDKGEAYYTDYSQNNGKSYLSQVVSPESYSNTVQNPGFETGRKSPWQFSGSSNPISVKSGSVNGYGNYFIRVEGNLSEKRVACQNVLINGSANDVFVVGGYAKVNNSVPVPNRFIGIQIYKCELNDDEEYVASDELLCSVSFDQTLSNEAQFRLGAFKLTEAVEAVQFQFVCAAQTGQVDFDDAILYESSSGNVSFFDTDSSPIDYNTSSESGTSAITNDKGLIVSETYSNGEKSMLLRYVYNDKYNISSYINNNNIFTSYEYDDNAGILLSETISGTKTEFSYTPMGVLKEVSRATAGLTDNANEIKTTYSYSFDRIESVVSKGMKYTFVYNSFGNVKSVDIEPVEPITSSRASVISYNYSDDAVQTLDSISYVNGDTLYYTYDASGNVISVRFSDSNNLTPVELYSYEYTNGTLSKIIDKFSGREVIYSGEDYIVKEYLEDETTEGTAKVYYSVTTDENGQKVVNLFGNIYTYAENSTEFLNDTNETKYISGYSFGFDNATTEIEILSISDYFGRTVKSDTTFSSSANTSVKYTLSNTKTYKDYTATVGTDCIEATTNLLALYKSEIVKTTTDAETNVSTPTVLNSFTTTYNYDAAGRITHIYYSQGTGANELAAYYEYDTAGQLILEVNPIEETLKKYKYDSNGNITSKEIYKGSSDFSFNNTSCTAFFPETSSPEIINYGYHEEYSDLMTSYNGNAIPFDVSGNPLKYYNGEDGNNTEYNLTWKANKLVSVETADGEIRYDYTYDSNGLRTSKIGYSIEKSTNINEEDVVEISQITNYIWDDNSLVGYHVYLCDESEPAELIIKIIYDDYNSPVGVHYTSLGLEDEDSSLDGIGMANDDILWFIKDGQGNVKGIYSDTSNYTLGCTYDAAGNISLDISGGLMENLQEQIAAAEEAWKKVLLALVSSLVVVAVTVYTLELGQTTYRSYIMDIETGLYYCNNRYYSPVYGRFINMSDPIKLTEEMENPLNANLFTYCNNDPINYTASLDRSSYSLSAVGIQADMSSCFISPSGELGVEMIYDWSKDEMYSYYYYSGGASTGYANRALNYLINAINHISTDSDISLQNLANWFKINWSISLNYFSVYTDKSFSWPYSYSGVSRSRSMDIGNDSGYITRGSGYQVYGISFSPISPSGFTAAPKNSQRTRIAFTAQDIANYLSANKTNIINAVS